VLSFFSGRLIEPLQCGPLCRAFHVCFVAFFAMRVAHGKESLHGSACFVQYDAKKTRIISEVKGKKYFRKLALICSYGQHN
jgi:hypothetical protein